MLTWYFGQDDHADDGEEAEEVDGTFHDAEDDEEDHLQDGEVHDGRGSPVDAF